MLHLHSKWWNEQFPSYWGKFPKIFLMLVFHLNPKSVWILAPCSFDTTWEKMGSNKLFRNWFNTVNFNSIDTDSYIEWAETHSSSFARANTYLYKINANIWQKSCTKQLSQASLPTKPLEAGMAYIIYLFSCLHFFMEWHKKVVKKKRFLERTHLSHITHFHMSKSPCVGLH